MKISNLSKSLITGIFLLTTGSFFLIAQEENNFPIKLETVKIIKTTPVKSQGRTGTCWSFATTSFIETELLRMGKAELDLSEMFFVRYAYESKADLFIRYHGMANFGPGGQAHDVMNVIRDFGMATEQSYPGIMYGGERHNHSELNTVLEAYVEGVRKAKQISPVWKKAFSSILDTYLGPVPEKMKVNDNELSPKDIAASMDFNPDDYIELSSFTHHPYYKSFVLEVPDNWSNDSYYNLPIEELMEIIVNALKKDYSVCWDGDMSDPGFSHRKGLAVVPEKDWKEMTASEKDSVFTQPIVEKQITPEMRQEMFNNFKMTDDHLMHFTGLFKDENGKYFYLTKNSWGESSNDYKGFLYMSDAFLRKGTVAIMVHKDAIPKKILKKLGL